ncbi:hypothetical protein ACFV6F_32355 [Kitasatospora phosalacinea]|uniref:hypothetical protein n=1 Tax=Kitasatospora phosalacinea TaxID=2065 RepID=UPI0036559D97
MTPPTAPGAAVPPRTAPGGAVRALARAEAGRLLRHPALLAALALYAATWAPDLAAGDAAHRFPVLQDESWAVHRPLLLLAAGALLAANQAALRSHRDGTEPLYGVLAVGRFRRVRAHLLSLLPAVLLAAALTAARAGYLAARPGAVGEFGGWDLLAGPLCVLLAGVTGVLLAVLATSGAVAPTAVVGLGVLTFAGALDGDASWRWLGLLAFEDENAAPLPTALTGRPAAAHAGWLAALAVLLAAAAVLRAGGRGAGLRAVAAVAGAGVLVTGVVQTRGVPSAVAVRRAAFTDHPAAHQDCTVENGVAYCAFAGFDRWKQEWRQVAEGVLRRVPQDVAGAGYTVRQRVLPSADANGGTALPASWSRDDAAAGTPGAVTVGTDWSDGSAAGDRRSDAVAEFAAGFAYRVVTGEVPERPGLSMVCGSRAVLVLWLAGSATPGTGEALRSTRDRTFGGAISMPLLGSSAGVAFEPRAAELAFALLERDGERDGGRDGGRLAAAVGAGWAELSARGTTVDRAAELLGVPAPRADEAGSGVAGC